MPSSDYTSVTRGALKLKGSKVQKSNKKSKKSKDKTSNNLETALQRTSETEDDSKKPIKSQEEVELETRKSTSPAQEGDQQQQLQEQEPEEDLKTEAERRFAEIKRKRLKELAESSKVRPELLKTHKQRVEELNSHLSRLSEHHDMPKIGPG